MLGLEVFEAKGERVITDRVRHLVHKAFDIKSVLVTVDATPETCRYMRIAHCVVDQQVGHIVAECPLGAAGIEALENDRILAILHACRNERRQDGLSGNAHMQPDQFIVGIERGSHAALRDRVIGVVGVSSSRDHKSLIGVPGISLATITARRT